MAHLRCDFFSDVLGLSTSMSVILPQETTRQIGLTGHASDDPPLLYLLHGLSDDDTIWVRRTSIERYAAEHGLAVVMPAVHRSFYTDEVHGLPFWTFLTEELPAIVHRLFRVTDDPARTFVAGLSMGGYGAMKWALRRPGTFAAAASLSGALGLSDYALTNGPDVPTFARVFGDAITGTENDLLTVVAGIPAEDVPALYVACGTEDFLYPQNRAFLRVLAERGIPCTTDIGPGDHEWSYWDARIRDVLDWLPLR